MWDLITDHINVV